MANKVLLIVVDGMRPDSIPVCGDERLEKFFKSGSYSFQAKTVFPSVTLPCHMSLFHSVDPERHGVYNNIFVQQNHPITGLVETLVAAKKKAAFFYTWEQLRDLCTPGKHLSFNWFMGQHVYEFPEIEYRATAAAKEHIKEFEPDFVFLYLGGADVYGHDYGWMTPKYMEEVRVATECIEDICASIPEDYTVIVTADHGGHGRNHGENIPEDMTIPVVFRGKQFPVGMELEAVDIKDIAPTILDVMEVEPNPEWEGKSILRVLSGEDENRRMAQKRE